MESMLSWNSTMAFDLPLLIYVLLFLSVASISYWFILVGQDWVLNYEKIYSAKTQYVLEELFIFHNAKKLFWLNLTISLFFVLISVFLFQDIVFVIASALIGFLGPKFLMWRAKQKRIEKFALQFVDGLLILGNALRAGLTLPQALEVLEQETFPPLSQEFGLALKENRLGVPMEKALQSMTKRIDNDDLKLMVMSVNIIYGMGGNLIEIFESLATVIRERTKLEQKTKSLTAQGRIQGIVVGLLPTGLGGIMFLIEPNLMIPMFTTIIGNIALGIMLVLQITGFLILQKITRIDI